MYQEMLNLVRDYSDVRTQMNSDKDDPLSTDYEQEFLGGVKNDGEELDLSESFEDRDDSDTESECDRLVKEELKEEYHPASG